MQNGQRSLISEDQRLITIFSVILLVFRHTKTLVTIIIVEHSKLWRKMESNNIYMIHTESKQHVHTRQD